jgi:ADP-ribosylglycohydrolase
MGWAHHSKGSPAKRFTAASVPYAASSTIPRSVTSAIQCFANHPDSYNSAVGSAIALGNDTDTLAAMAGAISGARLGIAALPAKSLAMMEGGAKGIDYVNKLAVDLAEVRISRTSPRTF